MDVLVTVPKGYRMAAKIMADICYWRVRGTPRKTKKGEKIYFVHDGEIAMVADIVKVSDGYIDFVDLRGLSEPREKYPGFRGFRYREARP